MEACAGRRSQAALAGEARGESWASIAGGPAPYRLQGGKSRRQRSTARRCAGSQLAVPLSRSTSCLPLVPAASAELLSTTRLPSACGVRSALRGVSFLPQRSVWLGARLRKRLRPARLTRRGRTWCAWARAGRRSLHHRLDPAGHQGRPARAWPGGPACALDAARGSMQRQLDCSRPRNGQAHAARLAGSAP